MRLATYACLVIGLTLAMGGVGHATTMVANLSGDFNDDWYYSTWTLQIKYKTEFAQIIDESGGQALYWNSSSAAPSPVTSVTGTVVAKTNPPGWWPEDEIFVPNSDVYFEFSDITFFKVTRPDGRYNFQISDDAGRYLDLGYNQPGATFSSSYPLDGDYDGVTYAYGNWNVGTVSGGSGPHVHFGFTVERVAAPVPEPGAWGTLILGLTLAGSAIRRQRRNAYA